METVFIHPYAGVLSAYGMGLADQSVMREQAIERLLSADVLPELIAEADRLGDEATARLAAQGADPATSTLRRRLHLRYAGTEAALEVEFDSVEAMTEAFTAAHRARFGFATPGRALMAEAIGVEAVAQGETVVEASLAQRTTGAPVPIDVVEMWSGGTAHATPVFGRTELLAGDRIRGRR